MSHEQHAEQNYVVWGTGWNPVAHLLVFRLQPTLNIILTVLAGKFKFCIFLGHPVVSVKVKTTKLFLVSVKHNNNTSQA
jgi:hypothetical protein